MCVHVCVCVGSNVVCLVLQTRIRCRFFINILLHYIYITVHVLELMVFSFPSDRPWLLATRVSQLPMFVTWTTQMEMGGVSPAFTTSIRTGMFGSVSSTFVHRTFTVDWVVYTQYTNYSLLPHPEQGCAGRLQLIVNLNVHNSLPRIFVQVQGVREIHSLFMHKWWPHEGLGCLGFVVAGVAWI